MKTVKFKITTTLMERELTITPEGGNLWISLRGSERVRSLFRKMYLSFLSSPAYYVGDILSGDISHTPPDVGADVWDSEVLLNLAYSSYINLGGEIKLRIGEWEYSGDKIIAGEDLLPPAIPPAVYRAPISLSEPYPLVTECVVDGVEKPCEVRITDIEVIRKGWDSWTTAMLVTITAGSREEGEVETMSRKIIVPTAPVELGMFSPSVYGEVPPELRRYLRRSPFISFLYQVGTSFFGGFDFFLPFVLLSRIEKEMLRETISMKDQFWFLDAKSLEEKNRIITYGIYRVSLFFKWNKKDVPYFDRVSVAFRNLSEPFTAPELVKISPTPLSLSATLDALSTILAEKKDENIHIVFIGVPGTGKTTNMWALIHNFHMRFPMVAVHFYEGVPEALNFYRMIPHSDRQNIPPDLLEAEEVAKQMFRKLTGVTVIGELLGRTDFHTWGVMSSALTMLTTFHSYDLPSIRRRLREYNLQPDIFRRSIIVQTLKEETPDGYIFRHLGNMFVVRERVDERKEEEMIVRVNGVPLLKVFRKEREARKRGETEEFLRFLKETLKTDTEEEEHLKKELEKAIIGEILKTMD